MKKIYQWSIILLLLVSTVAIMQVLEIASLKRTIEHRNKALKAVWPDTVWAYGIHHNGNIIYVENGIRSAYLWVDRDSVNQLADKLNEFKLLCETHMEIIDTLVQQKNYYKARTCEGGKHWTDFDVECLSDSSVVYRTRLEDCEVSGGGNTHKNKIR